jgi:hypothetical protein
MAVPDLRVRQLSNAVDVSLHIQPRARRTELAGTHNGALKLKVQAPPVDDAANLAVVRFFSELLGIPKSRILITSGAKSRDKTLRIEGISVANFLRLLPTRFD